MAQDEHETYQLSTESASLNFSGGELKVKESSFLSGYGLRMLKEKRLGFAYCQEEKEIEKALAQAERMSKFSPQTSFSFAPKSSFKNPEMFDDALAAAPLEELKGFVDEAKDAAESLGGNSRVILSSGNSSIRLENTAGFSGAYKRTDFSLYVETMHDDGFGFAYLASNNKPPSVSELGLKAANMARSMRGAKKPESGGYTAVLELEALDSILEILLPSFSGDWKRRGITKLESGKKFFSEMLNMKEDGLAPGTDARPFDDEGTPSEPRPLIERGVVSSFLFDRETAALAKAKGDGACSRSAYDAAPAIGQSNLVILPGRVKDLDELGKHIEIHYVHGSHTANATTGDFGLEVGVAFLVDGKERRPVRGFILSGNVFDLFAKIEAMEQSTRVLGGLVAPRIAFRDVRVVS